MKTLSIILIVVLLSVNIFATIAMDKQAHFLGGAYMDEWMCSRDFTWWASGLTILVLSAAKEKMNDEVYDSRDIEAAMYGWAFNQLLNFVLNRGD